MENPFVKQNNTWIAAIAVGVAAVGAATYYLTRRNEPVMALVDNHTDYLNDRLGKMKKHKSDVDDLGDIVHHAQL